ncbi:MAG: acyclic terpene utilization AtuA family protein, partial [Rhodococcus sp. (in: high G+C Gram-positive bacteria)]|uniref:acyclic terpene utilization AtuA family protein n=1 Tax=Rhodococcus sp. TaxID=1831 RepID=UPI003BB1C4C8
MRESEAPRRPIRIGNASGFYGDRLSAFRDMVDGSPVDVITGDYLAELTMLILWKARKKDPTTGYAKTFLTQARQSLADCAAKGIKIVVNAGGLNPAGLAYEVRKLIDDQGLDLSVAHIEGDDIRPRLELLQADGHEFRHLDKGITLAEAGVSPVSANAYLGGWGIAAALRKGADVVICPRVTDAALVVGASAWWHGWAQTDFDALAGAVAAGHIIECGPQATGGNYSQIREVHDRRYPGSPIAEIAHDGSFVITKDPGTGGLVSVGTVTAQLLYEIDSPIYLNPDVAAHFETIEITQEGTGRVRVAGTTGSPPPPDLKVAMNYIGGFRNTMTLVLTGLDIEEKANWAVDELFEILGGEEKFDEVDVQLLRYDIPDPPTAAQSTAHLRVTVKDADRAKVDRAFSNSVTELAVAGYAGFHTTTPPSSASEFGVYWPSLIPADEIEHVVLHADGTKELIDHCPRTRMPEPAPMPASST